MKKRYLPIIALVIISLSIMTGCETPRSRAEGESSCNAAETETEADTEQLPEGECIFNADDVADEVTDYGRDHGLNVDRTLCYKSNKNYKIDTTRITTEFALKEKYQDAICDIVANGNQQNAKRTYFNVEPVLLNEDGYFILYINYEYELATN